MSAAVKKDNGTSSTAALWQEAMGLTSSGMCARHPSHAVYVPDSDNNTQQPVTLLVCPSCQHEDEASAAAMRQQQAMQAVVQQLQQNNTSNHHSDNNNSATATIVADNSSSFWNESIWKRLAAVQNWRIRQKETQISSLLSQIKQLERRLADSTQTAAEHNQTIRALRRTIQQDMKLIKTMATQKQWELEQQQQQAESSSNSDVHSSTLSPASLYYGSPSKRSSNHTTMLSDDDSTPKPSPVNPRLQAQLKFFQRASRARGVLPADSMRPAKSRPSPQCNLDLPIPEGDEKNIDDGEGGEEDEETTEGTFAADDVLPSSLLEPQRSSSNSYWSEADRSMPPSQIFHSFRGGLLDIPTSPPPPMHDSTRREQGKKLHLDSTDVSALQLPVRHLSRHNSSEPSPVPPPPRGTIVRQNSVDGDHLMELVPQQPPPRRGKKKPQQQEISLDLLAQKLTALPLSSRQLEHESPEQFFPETVSTSVQTAVQAPPLTSKSPPKAKPTVPAKAAAKDLVLPPKPTATSDETTSSNKPKAEGTVPKTEDAAPSTDKFLFTVTGAECQDRYGDVGSYTGTILVTEGLPHGRGTMHYESGRVYSGEWVSGQWNGQGELLNPNGDTYKGQFVFDARHGKGVYRWDNGDYYEGLFREDKRNGQGRFLFHNGNDYTGEFNDGMFDGHGRYKFEGGIYEGEWKDGKYHGNGTLTYAASGAKYTGEFRNSVAHGFGIEVTVDGGKRQGLWEHGQPVGSKQG